MHACGSSDCTQEYKAALAAAPPSGGPQLLTLEECAERLRCSRAHISNLINGKVPGVPPLPHARIGRRVLVRPEWLQAYLERVKG